MLCIQTRRPDGKGTSCASLAAANPRSGTSGLTSLRAGGRRNLGYASVRECPLRLQRRPRRGRYERRVITNRPKLVDPAAAQAIIAPCRFQFAVGGKQGSNWTSDTHRSAAVSCVNSVPAKQVPW
jgi:hypothetical protein